MHRIEAHRVEAEAERATGPEGKEEALYRWRCNDEAGKMAKQRVEDGLPAQSALKCTQTRKPAQTKWLQGVGRILGQWPRAHELVPTNGRRGRRVPQAALDKLQVYHGHLISYSVARDRRHCKLCLASCAKGRRQALQEAQCRAPSAAEEEALRTRGQVTTGTLRWKGAAK